MRLKRYQQGTLDVLTRFLKNARLQGDPAAAFNGIITGEEQAARLKGYSKPYKAIKGLEGVPYACLRLPTGGGKTLLAAHTIIQARDHWLERDYPVVLWLVPSDAIRRQTVEALKDPRHFYRQALDEAFEGRVRVFDIADFTQVTPSDLASKLCVFVGTVQTLKVSNINGRKVYAHHEMLEPHFAKISPNTPGLERNDDGPFKGDIRFSFANLMHVHNPLVIVDEAHNAVTSLADEMQRRINPSAIIQFTATPKNKSNILHSVTAQELKDEQMIKMPVVLEEHETWQSAVNGAILRQAQLEEEAKRDRDNYIRPIVLFQAQNKDQPVNVDALRDHLVEVKNIPPEKIAVVTGKQRELDGIDLKDPASLIDYVITVQALKEGWDCSFAYVFCSVANIGASGDAEQLLGRVLRMPYATRRTSAMLNKSYACLSSPKFQDAVKGLVDKLVDMGFDESEVAENIEHAQPELLDGFFGRKPRPTPTFDVSIDAPVEEIKGIERAAPLKINVGPDALGKAKVTVKDFLTPAQEKAVFEQMPEKHHGAFQEELAKFKAENHDKASPAQRGEEFVVPRLMAQVQDEFVFADNDLLIEYHDWTLRDHAHQLTEKQFSIRQVANTFEVDLDEGSLQVQLKDQPDQLSLDIGVDGWTEQGLVLWLDRKVRDRYIGQGELVSWLSAVVAHLINDRGITLSTLMRCQYVLARRLQDRLAEIYTIERNKVYQGSLFEGGATPSLSFENGFRFFDGMFEGVRTYQGRTVFAKHFTGKNQVPAFDGRGEDGEEFQCAMFLDANAKVKHWVRNVANHPNAFWLPMAGGKFYPDFVAELENGQILVVEYKGEHLRTNQDTKDKMAVGTLWEKVSDGRGLFLLALKDDQGVNMRDQLNDKLAKI
jgi:type III restriction enzyme